MKKATVLLLIFLLLAGSVFAQAAAPAPAVPDLTALSQEAAKIIREAVPPRLGRDSGIFYFRGITFNGAPVPLGDLLDSMVLNRVLPLGIRNLTFWGPENPPGVIPAEEGKVLFGLSGEIYRIGQDMMVSLRVFRHPNFEVIGSAERVFPLGPEILSLLGTPAGGSMDLFEPNNTASAATPFTLGETLENLSLGGSDEDWFVLDLSGLETGAEMVYLTLGTRGNLDTVMSLYGPDNPGLYVMENDDAEDSNAKIQAFIDRPGYYYAMVRGYDSDTQGSYSLFGSLDTVEPEEGEPNNIMERAEYFPLDQESISRKIHPGGDYDWYRLDLSNHTLAPNEVMVLETQSGMDTYLELYRGNEFIASDDDGGMDGNARIEFQPDGDSRAYHLMVKGYDSETVGDYVLLISRRTIQADQYEPDNTMSEATLIEVDGRRQAHNFELPDEIDWFKLVLNQGRNVTIETFGETDTFLYLYSEQGETLAESDDDGSDYNGKITRFLPRGTHYFTVEPYSRDGNLSYEVSVSP